MTPPGCWARLSHPGVFLIISRTSFTLPLNRWLSGPFPKPIFSMAIRAWSRVPAPETLP
ncbi:Uncharacterised protein [Salmonella enterica subsp. houtenae]|nr:Uncharacterised protein [Salmonella enterica subsp. houtenae]